MIRRKPNGNTHGLLIAADASQAEAIRGAR
jgi:hypothetical protein